MASLSSARAAALASLSEARRRDARIRDLMRTSRAVAALDARDRALASRLAIGCVRARGTLDALVDAHLRPGAKLEPRLRDALRLSAFEVCYLATPVHVAVSQGVLLAASVAPRARGLANAVLRRIAEKDAPRVAEAASRLAEPHAAPEPARANAAADLVDDLALVAAVPAWLARATLDSVGAAVARRLALGAFDAPAATVALNPFAQPNPAPAESPADALAAAGLNARPLAWPGALALDSMAGLAASGLVQATRVLPADLAAQVVATLVAPTSDACLLEVGQGRATKTVLMAARAASAGATARITSIDLEPFKVKLARERLARAGLADSCESLALDARRLADAPADLPPQLARAFDRVFVDAPCSGSGTLRRHPEIAWSLDEASVAEKSDLPELQFQILSAASARVRSGGLLFYSTCSNLVSENESVVSRFLASDAGRDFSLEPVDLDAASFDLDADARALLGGARGEAGFLRTAGAELDGVPLDGHFLARLRRA